MAQATKQASTAPHSASTADSIEAEIRKRAQPLLTPEERRKKGAESSLLGVKMAAARSREAAAKHLAQADEWEAQAAALAKQIGE